MTASITFNPISTTVASGSFNAESTGFIQGTMLDDPAVRYQMAGGILASSETLPMWGGCAITEDVTGGTNSYVGTPGNPNNALGGQIFRATALTGSKAITGFSVSNQNSSMLTTPQSPVPLTASGMQVNFLRLGTNARIIVAADPILAALGGTAIITTAVAWDFVNQQLIPQVTTINVSSGTYNSTTGLVTLTLASAPGISPGDSFTIAGITGTGSVASLNGTFTAATGTTGTTLTYFIATTLTLTITAATGTFTTGSALSVKLLEVLPGNSMTVTYNATTGFATWNRSGTTAVILI